jgi:hypothetical protein
LQVDFIRDALIKQKGRTFENEAAFVSTILEPLNKHCEENGLTSRFVAWTTEFGNYNLRCTHCETILTCTRQGEAISYKRCYRGYNCHLNVGAH